MTAYVIADTEIVDPALGRRYRDLAGKSIARYGGRYVVRGGTVEPVEGDWNPKLFVIVEFPSLTRAREWYESPEYAEALVLRRTARRQGARASGTPFISFFTPSEMLELAQKAGFGEVMHVSAAALTERYFAQRRDGLRPANGAEEGPGSASARSTSTFPISSLWSRRCGDGISMTCWPSSRGRPTGGCPACRSRLRP